MWVSVLVLQNLGIFDDGSSSIENSSLDVGHILAEAGVLVLNLVCKFTGVTHHENRGFASDRLNLLESCEDEDSSLTKTRFGLAENVGSEDSLRNADLLYCKAMEPMSDNVSLKVYNDAQEIASAVHLRSMIAKLFIHHIHLKKIRSTAQGCSPQSSIYFMRYACFRFVRSQESLRTNDNASIKAGFCLTTL